MNNPDENTPDTEDLGTLEQAAAALHQVERFLVADRDTFYESITSPAGGAIPDPNDRRALSEYDDLIRQVRAALARASSPELDEPDTTDAARWRWFRKNLSTRYISLSYLCDLMYEPEESLDEYIDNQRAKTAIDGGDNQ